MFNDCEGLISRVVRLAWAKGQIKKLEDFVNFFGKRKASLDAYDVPILSQITGASQSLNANTLGFPEEDLSNISLAYRLRRPIKVCACCMAESAFLRSSWESPSKAYCHKHNSPLIYSCPNCSSIFKPNLQVIGNRCHNCCLPWKDIHKIEMARHNISEKLKSDDILYDSSHPGEVSSPAIYFGSHPNLMLYAPHKIDAIPFSDTTHLLFAKRLVINDNYRDKWIKTTQEKRLKVANLGSYAHYSPIITYANLASDKALLNKIEEISRTDCRLAQHSRLETPAVKKSILNALKSTNNDAFVTDIHGLARSLGVPGYVPNKLLNCGLVSLLYSTERNSNALFDLTQVAELVNTTLVTTHIDGITLEYANYIYSMYGVDNGCVIEDALKGLIAVKLKEPRFGLFQGATFSLVSVIRQCRRLMKENGQKLIPTSKAKQIVGVSSRYFSQLIENGHFTSTFQNGHQCVPLKQIQAFLSETFSVKRYTALRRIPRHGMTSRIREHRITTPAELIYPAVDPQVSQIRLIIKESTSCR